MLTCGFETNFFPGFFSYTYIYPTKLQLPFLSRLKLRWNAVFDDVRSVCLICVNFPINSFLFHSFFPLTWKNRHVFHLSHSLILLFYIYFLALLSFFPSSASFTRKEFTSLNFRLLFSNYHHHLNLLFSCTIHSIHKLLSMPFKSMVRLKIQ